MKIMFHKVVKKLNERGFINFMPGKSYYQMEGDDFYANYLINPRKFEFIEGEGSMILVKFEDEDNMRVIHRGEHNKRFIHPDDYKWLVSEENLINEKDE